MKHLLPITAAALAAVAHAQGTYTGREPSAPWRAPALARIEQLRKADFTLRVVDAAGQPVAGAGVTVTQQRHAFPFGTALQMARIVQDTAANRIYRQKTAALFNAASTENDLKWGPWIGEWGPGYSRTQTLAGLRWLANRGFQLRGHVLVWPGWDNLPTAVSSLQNTPRQSQIPQMVLDHIAEMAAATAGLVPEWDALNEPYTNHSLMDVFGRPIMLDWFRSARVAMPAAALFLNDYNNHNQVREADHVRDFESTARYLLQGAAPLTGLGLQAHIGGSPDSIPDVLATLDRYAPLGLPIRITEFDINTTDESLQADYARDFLTASFSHASIAGFQFWGFWESAHWRPNAAMYRTDWSEKPNGAAYRALVFDQWWTRFAGTTDAPGTFHGRGFHGDYVATVTVNGRTVEKTFSLRSGGAPPVVEISTEPPRLANLATRASVNAATEAPIAGFVISGTAAKLVLVRAVGPALANFGVTGVLARPTLTLFRDAQAIATNTGWSTASNSAEIAAAATQAGGFALAPGAADSAMLVRLAPGAYTARVTAADGGTGIALVEAYDAEPGSSRFANVSTRAFVGTGAGIVIPGLVVAGRNARTILLRGIGPGLADFGVTGVLARPAIVLMRGASALHANDRWETASDPALLATAARNAGAFALKPGSADAALLATLEPGPYTVLISGADGGTGNCLVEIYEVNN